MRPGGRGREPLMRLVWENGAFGAGLGLVAAALVVAGDVAGLGRLVLEGADAGLALACLAAGLMSLGAAACISTGVMLVRAEPEPEGRPGPGVPALVPVPARRARPVRRG